MARIRLPSQFSKLTRLYQIGVGPTELDEVAPIQPVHELGRTAELATGVQLTEGYSLLRANHVHVAADTMESTLDPYGSAVTSSLENLYGKGPGLNFWAWLVGASVVGGSLSSASAVIQTHSLGSAISLPFVTASDLLLLYGSNVVQINEVDLAGALQITTYLPLPFPLLSGFLLGLQSISSGATTAGFRFLIWSGARGVMPPGMM